MAERPPRDNPEYMKNFKGFLDNDVTDKCFVCIPGDSRDSDLQEESTKINPDLCDDGAAQEPQVKGSASASSSAISEANKKTDASSSSRKRETGEIRRVDKEKDRNDDDDGDTPKESDNESDLDKRYPEIYRYYDRFLGLSNHGSTSSTSDRTNISQTIGMQSQLSPWAEPWRLQNTYQQHQVANQMYPYPHPLANQMYPYQHPVPNQMYPYQHPVANQMYPYQHPVPPNQMYPYQHPVPPNQMYPYQQPVPNQQNFYQHPVDSQQDMYHYPMDMVDPRVPQFRHVARGQQPRSFGRGQTYFNPRQARPQLNQQMQQRVPQAQQPRQSQGFSVRPSSEQGQDQQQPM